MFLAVSVSGQNISITFTGAGEASQVDSVTAINLRTGESVTLPGNETLVLALNTGISSISGLISTGVVFPNPFSGKATFSTIVAKPQTVYLKLINPIGQLIAQTKAFVQPGKSEFAFSVKSAGIYTVSITTVDETTGYRVICTDASGSENRIQYIGALPGASGNPLEPELKTTQSGYILGFLTDDLILYLFRSGQYQLRLVEKPTVSKKIEAMFVSCTDLDGKNYSTVKIDTQTWMAENLAYLPSVSPSATAYGSETSPYYYVQGYEGTSASIAKATAQYAAYGVLYNWEAAKIACPAGWHLPTDPEWATLTTYLGGLPLAGGKMKETGTAHWASASIAASNSSGLTVPGGGRRYFTGGVGYLTQYAYYWTSTQETASAAYDRFMNYLHNGATREFTSKKSGFSVRCVKN
jgi:uncharacterized protein (TIGR02145 family)